MSGSKRTQDLSGTSPEPRDTPISNTADLRDLAHKTLDAYLDAGGSNEFVIVSRRDLERNSEYMQCRHCKGAHLIKAVPFETSDGLLGNNSSESEDLPI